MNIQNWTRYLMIGAAVLLAVGILWYFSTIVSYIIVSWVLSMIGQPLMKLFAKVRIKSWRPGAALRAALTLLTFLVVIAALFALFLPLIITQARNLSEVNYFAIAEALEEPINQFRDWMMQRGLLLDEGSGALDKVQETLFSTIAPSKVSGIFNYIVGTAGNLLISVFSVLFITFFFLKEEGMFIYILQSFVPDKYDQDVKDIVNESSEKLTNYFGGVLIQISTITAFVSITLSLLGIPNALLIGFFAALINIIPYVGPLIGGLFGMLVTISSNLNVDFYDVMLPMIGKVFLTFAFVQMLDNFILQPSIFSRQLQVHPLLIFFIILIGAELGGIPGMVLAMPVFMIIRVIGGEFFETSKIMKRLDGEKVKKAESD